MEQLPREINWLPERFKDKALRGWRLIDGERRGWRIETKSGWWYAKWDDQDEWERYYPATLD